MVNERFLKKPAVLPKKDFVSHSNFPFGPGFSKGEGLHDHVPDVESQQQLGPLKYGIERQTSQVFLGQDVPPNTCSLKDTPRVFS